MAYSINKAYLVSQKFMQTSNHVILSVSWGGGGGGGDLNI